MRHDDSTFGYRDRVPWLVFVPGTDACRAGEAPLERAKIHFRVQLRAVTQVPRTQKGHRAYLQGRRIVACGRLHGTPYVLLCDRAKLGECWKATVSRVERFAYPPEWEPRLEEPKNSSRSRNSRRHERDDL